MKEIYSFNLAHNTEKLKELIAEHPDYDIVFLAGDEANSGDYGYMYCAHIRFEVGEILDADYKDEEMVFTDRLDFEDRVEKDLEDMEGSDEEYKEAVKAIVKKYEPYWKKVIAIYADN